jgi:hypothetical protein
MKTIATILGFTILISSAQQEKKTSNQAPQKVENAKTDTSANVSTCK